MNDALLRDLRATHGNAKNPTIYSEAADEIERVLAQRPTVEEIVRALDSTPATTWAGTGGAKERLLTMFPPDEDR